MSSGQSHNWVDARHCSVTTGLWLAAQARVEAAEQAEADAAAKAAAAEQESAEARQAAADATADAQV